MSMEFRILDNGSLQNFFQKNFGLQKYFWNLLKKATIALPTNGVDVFKKTKRINGNLWKFMVYKSIIVKKINGNL